MALESMREIAVPTKSHADFVRDEYHQLVDLEISGRLSTAQHARLRCIEQELDDRDERSQAAWFMRVRLEETENKLDQILNVLRALPKSK